MLLYISFCLLVQKLLFFSREVGKKQGGRKKKGGDIWGNWLDSLDTQIKREGRDVEKEEEVRKRERERRGRSHWARTMTRLFLLSLPKEGREVKKIFFGVGGREGGGTGARRKQGLETGGGGGILGRGANLPDLFFAKKKIKDLQKNVLYLRSKVY